MGKRITCWMSHEEWTAKRLTFEHLGNRPSDSGQAQDQIMILNASDEVAPETELTSESSEALNNVQNQEIAIENEALLQAKSILACRMASQELNELDAADHLLRELNAGEDSPITQLEMTTEEHAERQALLVKEGESYKQMLDSYRNTEKHYKGLSGELLRARTHLGEMYDSYNYQGGGPMLGLSRFNTVDVEEDLRPQIQRCRALSQLTSSLSKKLMSEQKRIADLYLQRLTSSVEDEDRLERSYKEIPSLPPEVQQLLQEALIKEARLDIPGIAEEASESLFAGSQEHLWQLLNKSLSINALEGGEAAVEEAFSTVGFVLLEHPEITSLSQLKASATSVPNESEAFKVWQNFLTTHGMDADNALADSLEQQLLQQTFYHPQQLGVLNEYLQTRVLLAPAEGFVLAEQRLAEFFSRIQALMQSNGVHFNEAYQIVFETFQQKEGDFPLQQGWAIDGALDYFQRTSGFSFREFFSPYEPNNEQSFEDSLQDRKCVNSAAKIVNSDMKVVIEGRSEADEILSEDFNSLYQAYDEFAADPQNKKDGALTRKDIEQEYLDDNEHEIHTKIFEGSQHTRDTLARMILNLDKNAEIQEDPHLKKVRAMHPTFDAELNDHLVTAAEVIVANDKRSYVNRQIMLWAGEHPHLAPPLFATAMGSDYSQLNPQEQLVRSLYDSYGVTTLMSRETSETVNWIVTELAVNIAMLAATAGIANAVRTGVMTASRILLKVAAEEGVEYSFRYAAGQGVKELAKWTAQEAMVSASLTGIYYPAFGVLYQGSDFFEKSLSDHTAEFPKWLILGAMLTPLRGASNSVVGDRLSALATRLNDKGARLQGFLTQSARQLNDDVLEAGLFYTAKKPIQEWGIKDLKKIAARGAFRAAAKKSIPGYQSHIDKAAALGSKVGGKVSSGVQAVKARFQRPTSSTDTSAPQQTGS